MQTTERSIRSLATAAADPFVRALHLRPLLLVIARKTGRVHEVAVEPPFPFEGDQYLVADPVDPAWVDDLRVEGGGVLETGSRHVAFRAIELTGMRAARVIHAHAIRIHAHGGRRIIRTLDRPRRTVFRIVPTVVLRVRHLLP